MAKAVKQLADECQRFIGEIELDSLANSRYIDALRGAGYAHRNGIAACKAP
jgi:hypothetical protein